MDLNRAKQIISSSADIEVTYHGVPVWLLHTNEADNTVSIKPETNPDDIMILPVDALVEGERKG